MKHRCCFDLGDNVYLLGDIDEHDDWMFCSAFENRDDFSKLIYSYFHITYGMVKDFKETFPHQFVVIVLS